MLFAHWIFNIFASLDFLSAILTQHEHGLPNFSWSLQELSKKTPSRASKMPPKASSRELPRGSQADPSRVILNVSSGILGIILGAFGCHFKCILGSQAAPRRDLASRRSQGASRPPPRRPLAPSWRPGGVRRTPTRGLGGSQNGSQDGTCFRKA